MATGQLTKGLLTVFNGNICHASTVLANEVVMVSCWVVEFVVDVPMAEINRSHQTSCSERLKNSIDRHPIDRFPFQLQMQSIGTHRFRVRLKPSQNGETWTGRPETLLAEELRRISHKWSLSQMQYCCK